MIHFVVPRDQAFAIRDFLGAWGQVLAPRFSILHYEDLAAARTLPSGAYILSSLDQLRPSGLDLVASIHDQLLGAGSGVRILNHPRKTLLRLDLLSALHRQGLNPHRAVRGDGELWNLRYPVFVREEHGHNGTLTRLLQTPRELAEHLGLTVARGYRLQDLLVVEFCDTADATGYHRKYAAFIIGSRIIARSLAYAGAWMLKARATEFSPSMLEEERHYVLGNPHEAQIRRIAGIGGVEYGRIDYAVKDGKVVTWEINLNPTIGRRPGGSSIMPPELRELRTPTREAWVSGMVRAFEEIDPGGTGLPVIPITSRGRPLAPGALLRPHEAETRGGVIRKLLRPFKPAVMRLVRAVSPLLVRVTRRRE